MTTLSPIFRYDGPGLESPFDRRTNFLPRALGFFDCGMVVIVKATTSSMTSEESPHETRLLPCIATSISVPSFNHTPISPMTSAPIRTSSNDSLSMKTCCFLVGSK
uniref:Uncharacterized protein n=1 Tax=Alexandrium monilatum TaxID=311494 RepID=A0A7S4PV07_9DINO